MKHNRLSRESMLMSIARIIALRGTCSRPDPHNKVGVVIAKDNRIIATGYVGSPPGEPHCIDVGCKIGPDGGCIRTVHAEEAAINFAENNNISIEGSTLYTTLAPCSECAKLIIEKKIKKVIYGKSYRKKIGLNLLDYYGIECINFKEENSIFSLLLKLISHII